MGAVMSFSGKRTILNEAVHVGQTFETTHKKEFQRKTSYGTQFQWKRERFTMSDAEPIPYLLRREDLTFTILRTIPPVYLLTLLFTAFIGEGRMGSG